MSLPAVPTKLKVLRGNPGQRRILEEPEPTPVQETPPSLRILRGDALLEWFRATDELRRLNMLTVVDLQPLAAYCSAFGRWMEAEDAIHEMAKLDPVGKGLTVRGSVGNIVPNPLVRIADHAARQMVRYAAEFGFTPVARTRLGGIGGKERGPNKFKGLIAD
jgi:P27 family predicted phage terminase small subunit